MIRTLVTRLPAIALAAFMVFMGVQKFGADNVIFMTIAERSGIALFEPVIRIMTGVAELIAAVLLLIPSLTAVGALLSIALIGGAILFHLSPWLGVMVSMAPGEPATPMLFMMAVASFALTCFVLYRHRRALPFLGRG